MIESTLTINNAVPDAKMTIHENTMNHCIIHDSENYYLVIHRQFDPKVTKQALYLDVEKEAKKLGVNLVISEEQKWGSSSDFIIDMNGIDNFMYARSQIFSDQKIREIVTNLKLVEANKYLRFGAAGSPPSENHPGGEVFEYQIINVKERSGMAGSLSGFLDPLGEEYSKSTILTEDNISLREERAVYSHTIWIKEKQPDSLSLTLSLTYTDFKISLIDFIYHLVSVTKIRACGIKIYLRNAELANSCEISGRVLRRVPSIPFLSIQDATDIAVEKKFNLPPNNELFVVGTIYKRYEPDWFNFTAGHEYERRGHYHATIPNGTHKQIHETFHVRDIWLQNNVNVELQIFPVSSAYRIYPIHMEDGVFLLNSNSKKVSDLLYEINNI